MRKACAIVLILTGLLMTGTLAAHHSPSAVFDMAKPLVVKGTLTKVDWVNPHIVIFVDAVAADGSAEAWKFESNPPSWFRHVNLRRADFAKAVGQMVTIDGVRAKDGSRYGYMRKFTLASGDSIELDATTGGGPKP
jgi:hypothetical protein